MRVLELQVLDDVVAALDLEQGALALHGHALRAARQAGDVTGEANALRGLGSTNLWLGRSEPAGEQLRRARALFRLAGEHGGEARTELSLGLLARRLGRFEESSRHYDGALVLSEFAGNRLIATGGSERAPRTLVDDPELRTRLGEAARAHIAERAASDATASVPLTARR